MEIFNKKKPIKMDVEINGYSCPMSKDGTAFAISFNYTRLKDVEYINSPTFIAGGHQWRINLYPKQHLKSGIYASVYLQLEQENCLRAIYDLYLLDKEGKPSWNTFQRDSQIFESFGDNWGVHQFIEYAYLDEYINSQGCVVVICVIKSEEESCDQALKKGRFIEISQFDAHEDFSNLLEKGEMSDVTFQVEEVSFAAHKLIMATRSPVFKAELFGSMAESGTEVKSIMIKDMKSDVFKSLLHFVYTDSVPELDDGKASVSLAQHLLVAADRYGIERLKIICEEVLCKYMSLDTILSTLIISDLHNFARLKNYCLEFIAAPKNLLRLMLDKEYINMIHSSPSLLAEIETKTSQNSSFMEITSS